VTPVTPMTLFQGGTCQGTFSVPPGEVRGAGNRVLRKKGVADVSDPGKELLPCGKERGDVSNNWDREGPEAGNPFVFESGIDLPTRRAMEAWGNGGKWYSNGEGSVIRTEGVAK
jgi:hypothetical protein